MSDTWSDIQAVKGKQLSLREKMAKRKKERDTLLAGLDVSKKSKNTVPDESVAKNQAIERTTLTATNTEAQNDSIKPVKPVPDDAPVTATFAAKDVLGKDVDVSVKCVYDITATSEVVEKTVLRHLSDPNIILPLDVPQIQSSINKLVEQTIDPKVIESLLQKFCAQSLLLLKAYEKSSNTVVDFIDLTKLKAVSDELHGISTVPKKRKAKETDRKSETPAKQTKQKKQRGLSQDDDDDNLIASLLATETAKEKENKKMTNEINDLLSKPTAKEQSLVEKFRSVGGTQVQEFCQYGTRKECRLHKYDGECAKLHFKKIIHQHTDESLGDCSFLNTCFHVETCKYVHYKIDYPEGYKKIEKEKPVFSVSKPLLGDTHTMVPPQWVNCDIRKFDISVLGKVSVIMADPPWDIHMELPYGTMGDDEMRNLRLPQLQDDGYIFLWVTGRAMELGRECLTLWGYERIDELIWVKTNQLQRLIRTGRTGHWINHGKEHCLVGVKGNLKNVNRGLDCDVIVAEVRATSHKPDEVYGLIERLSPGTRKVELFGRMHNVQPNWITLGNQLDGVRLLEPDMVRRYKKTYPDGYKMS